MGIKIEKGKISAAIDFLFSIELVRKQSRFRRMFIDLAKKQLEAVEDERILLLEDHSRKDGEGKAIIKENNEYDIIDKLSLLSDQEELYKETALITGANDREMTRTIRGVLKGLEDIKYGKHESVIYDYLCDLFEVPYEDEGEEENA